MKSLSFSEKTAEICDAIIADGDAFDLIELGAGDATKSAYLLGYLLEKQADFTYLPIDISDNVISYLNVTLPVTLPGLQMNGHGTTIHLATLRSSRADGANRIFSAS